VRKRVEPPLTAAARRPRPTTILRAWLAFVGVVILGYIAIEAAGPTLDHRACELTAQTLGWALPAAGVTSQTVGDTVTGSSGTREFALRIIRECTAVSPLVLWLAAVLAFPCPARDKVWAVAIGAPILVLVNVVRLICLFWVGLLRPDAFETAHVLVWQSLMVLAVVGLWLVWVRLWVDRRAPRPA
jgi:archaeosortase B (VPXXXP-CTERM-specific)